jgi:capsular polysaccharide biosynthesis protein
MEQTEQNQDDEINIQELMAAIWKHKILIAIVTILVAAGAVVYAFLAREEFTSAAMFITKTGSGGGTSQNLSGLASLAGISLGNQSGVDPAAYLDKVVEDEYFLSPIIEKKWYYKGDSLYLDQILKIKPDTAKPDWKYIFKQQKLDILRKGMISVSKEKVSALKTSGVLSLTVNMPSAQLAYDVNLYTIGLLGNYLRNSMTSQAKEKRVFIEDRIAEIKPVLEASENALAQFKERNLENSSPKLMLTQMRLTRELNINQELYLQYKKQYELACIDEKNDQTLLQIIRNPEVPIFKTKPKRRMIVMGGFAGGMFLGCLIALMLDKIYKPQKSLSA